MAVIGAGSIIPFHLDALENLGFSFTSMIYKENVSNANQLKSRFGIQHISNKIQELENKKFDCILLASSVESLGPLLKELLVYKVPILVEKPVSLSLELFGSISNEAESLIQVAYNRRFYSSVREFKMRLHDIPQYSFDIRLPENSWNESMKLEAFIKNLKVNTVHGIDLLFYIFGEDLEIKYHSSSFVRNRGGLITCFLANTKSSGLLSISNGVPENYQVSARGWGARIELKPLELFKSYSGIEVREPSLDSPIRQYTPRANTSWQISQPDVKYKAGFFEQAKAFKAFVETKEFPLEAARISDARRCVEFCELLASRLIESA